MSDSPTFEIQGQTVRVPAIVRDASSGTAMYMINATAAQKLVPAAFEVVEAAPGQTQITIVIVDYRDNDLGDYDEVGIVFFVRPVGRPEAEVGSYIYKLPVNQSFTCEAGFKIWGFPKTVEDLDFNYAADTATCKLSMAGQHVLTLTVPRGGEAFTPDSAAVGYTMIEGVPHQNEFVRGGTGEQTISGGAGVSLELGDHALAEELRSLGLEGATPILSAWTEHMRGSFGASHKL